MRTTRLGQSAKVHKRDPPRMAPCGWRVQFRLAKGLLSVEAQPMDKVDWFAVVIVLFGMLPVALVAALLFWT
jgi:hypothetical protein